MSDNFARVICHGFDVPGVPPCELRYTELTPDQYDHQMDRPNQGWSCPACGASADFDDEFFEANLDKLEALADDDDSAS